MPLTLSGTLGERVVDGVIEVVRSASKSSSNILSCSTSSSLFTFSVISGFGGIFCAGASTGAASTGVASTGGGGGKDLILMATNSNATPQEQTFAFFHND